MTSIKPAHAAFARNLTRAMNARGFTQADLMSRANVHAPATHQLSRSNVSEYCTGRKMPAAIRLTALARALDVSVESLLPAWTPRTRGKGGETPKPPGPTRPDVSVENLGDGRARILLDHIMPWETVARIMKILDE